MGTTKFGTTNLLLQAGVVLKNGSGGGAPAVIETAPYTMAQLLNSDRYSFWKTSSLTGPFTEYDVDFRFPSSVSMSAAAVEGYRPASGPAFTIDVSYQTGAYTPAGVWLPLGTITNLSALGQRDDGIEFGAVTADSIRYAILPGAAGTAFSIGKLFAGLLTDTGKIHSIPGGGEYNPIQNRSEIQQEGGSFVINERGDDGMDIMLSFRALTLSEMVTLEALQKVRGTFLHVDARGRFFEVFLKDGKVKVARSFNDRFDVDVELKRAP